MIMKRIYVVSILAILLLLALAGPAAANGDDYGIALKNGTVEYSGTVTEDHTYYVAMNQYWSGDPYPLGLKYNATTDKTPYQINYPNSPLKNASYKIFSQIPLTIVDTLYFRDPTSQVPVVNVTLTIYKQSVKDNDEHYVNIYGLFSNFNTTYAASKTGEVSLQSVPLSIHSAAYYNFSTGSGSTGSFMALNHSFYFYRYSDGKTMPAQDQALSTVIGGFKNTYEIENTADHAKTITINRYHPGYDTASTLRIYDNNSILQFEQAGTTNETFNFDSVNALFVLYSSIIGEETIFDDRIIAEAGPEGTDTFHIAVKDASTGALIPSPDISIEELSTGATWTYSPPDGVQTSDVLMPGLLYNISATKTGYWGFWQNMQLIGGCYYPACYGNLVHLNLIPISTPTDPNKTTAAFRVYFQDTAYQGDQPVSGATIILSHTGYTDMYGSTNANGIEAFFVNKSVEYTYQITKTGYYAASGSFNISDPTPILVRMYLAPQGTPAVTTLPTPVLSLTSTPNYMEDNAARRAKENELGNMVYGASTGIAGLFICWIVIGILKGMGK
ncbi:MAG: hypothetical protein WC683_04820 [bacterium]